MHEVLGLCKLYIYLCHIFHCVYREVVEEGSCEGGEFHCSSGECVEIKKLCNGAPDCSDHSDEDINRFANQTFK